MMSGERPKLKGAPPPLPTDDDIAKAKEAFVGEAPMRTTQAATPGTERVVEPPPSPQTVSQAPQDRREGTPDFSDYEDEGGKAARPVGRPRKHEGGHRPLTIRVSRETYQHLRYLEYVEERSSIQDVAEEILRTEAETRATRLRNERGTP